MKDTSLFTEIPGFGTINRMDIATIGDSELINLVNSRDLAVGRIASGMNSNIASNGGYVNIVLIGMARSHFRILVKDFPIGDKEIFEAWKNVKKDKKEYYIDEKTSVRYVNQAQADRLRRAEERKVFIVDKKVPEQIQTTEYGEAEITRYLYQDVAKLYGESLFDWGIEWSRINLSEGGDDYSKNAPYIRPLLVYGKEGNSSLSCRSDRNEIFYMIKHPGYTEFKLNGKEESRFSFSEILSAIRRVGNKKDEESLEKELLHALGEVRKTRISSIT